MVETRTDLFQLSRARTQIDKCCVPWPLIENGKRLHTRLDPLDIAGAELMLTRKIIETTMSEVVRHVLHMTRCVDLSDCVCRIMDSLRLIAYAHKVNAFICM